MACTALSVAAWHAAGEERRLSDARVAALSEAIAAAGIGSTHATAPVRVSHLLSAPATDASTRRYLVVAGGMLVMAGAFALTVVTPRPRPHAAAPQPVSLELVALGQERAGSTLTVHGVVRNPRGDAAVDQIIVVVSAYDADGRLIASADAPIETATLAPGLESRFLVSVADASAAGRYRVSFRRGSRVIPHVDRRG